MEGSKFIAAGLVLEGCEVDAKGFVLLLQFIDLFLYCIVAGGVDLELCIEVRFELSHFAREALVFFFEISFP